MSDKTLFDSYTLGALTLSNRIVMASLTRNRAGDGLVLLSDIRQSHAADRYRATR